MLMYSEKGLIYLSIFLDAAFPLLPHRYQGKEGWAPASYLKKADILSQKMAAGGPVHASTNDLDVACKHQNANKENKENQRDRFSPFSDSKCSKQEFFFFILILKKSRKKNPKE